jgi:hypothetical protein
MGQRLRAVDLGYGTHAFILNGRVILILHFHFCTFNYVKKVFYLSFNRELNFTIALSSLLELTPLAIDP